MAIEFHKPVQPVTGPAYSAWFTLLASVVTVGLALYGANIALRFPLAFQMKR